ncbi:MAG: hypothetical protein NZ959_05930 [Armatimonadetes bacterium]|nr:hypothetical protein [Armatimonadota bacterium]MDW8121207.1 hypothetical protein [Armatimonadota bacterium]
MRFRSLIVLALIVIVGGAAVWQYSSQGAEDAAIREACREYLAKRYYFGLNFLQIRIADGYAGVVVEAGETLRLILKKIEGKWIVLAHGNLLTRDYLKKKFNVPERVLRELRFAGSGAFQ